MQSSDTIDHISLALSKAQGEIEDVRKDQQGYGYKYADLAQVLSHARPILSRHELAVLQDAHMDGENLSVTTRIVHSSGQWLELGPLTMVVEPKKGLSHAQCVGSVVTYARRYALTAALGIAQEDDDGASGGEKKTPAPAKRHQTLAEAVRGSLEAGEHLDVKQVLQGLSDGDKRAVWGLLSEDEHKQIKTIMEAQ